MKKYLVTYHMPMSFMEMAEGADPEEMKAGMDAAEALLAAHPHLAWSPDCEVEVHEMAGGSG